MAALRAAAKLTHSQYGRRNKPGARPHPVEGAPVGPDRGPQNDDVHQPDGRGMAPKEQDGPKQVARQLHREQCKRPAHRVFGAAGPDEAGGRAHEKVQDRPHRAEHPARRGPATWPTRHTSRRFPGSSPTTRSPERGRRPPSQEIMPRQRPGGGSSGPGRTATAIGPGPWKMNGAPVRSGPRGPVLPADLLLDRGNQPLQLRHVIVRS